MLDDPNVEAMRWSEDGRSIFLIPGEKFHADLLKKLSTESYDSLIRRLYRFGFHKIRGVDGAYHHDQFIRDQLKPSTIQTVWQTSLSPSPASMCSITPRSGPRYKVIKRKRTRQNV